MKGRGARGSCLFALLAAACNGQFDFDTSVDGGSPPVIVIEGGPDASIEGETSVDTPPPGVHIPCGPSECLTSGCCGKSSGFSCVDTAEGGTCSGLLIQCDDTDDCPPGQVCCAEGEALNRPPCTSDVCDVNPRLLRVHCEPESRCKGDFVVLCHADRPSPCTQCIASPITGLPPGYHQCATLP